MSIRDISTNNSRFILKIGNIPHIIDYFSPESDMWAVDDIETGGLEITPDGKPIGHTKNAVKIAQLTLSGASAVAEKLRELLNNQSRSGTRLAEIVDIAAIIESTAGVESYLDGRVISGPSGFTYGNEKLSDQTFTLAFPTRIFVGNGELGTTL